jgi:hypothetical protein
VSSRLIRSASFTDYCQLLIADYYCYACGPGDLKQTVVMTVGELLEELDGVDRNTEIAIATERPKGSWAIESVALVEEDGSPTIFLHCDVPRY